MRITIAFILISVAICLGILAAAPGNVPSSRAVDGAALNGASLSVGDSPQRIRHLIVVVGENRSFDNVFATYVPPDPKQSVWNLLSQGIVQKTGGPGLNVKKALQQRAIDHDTYQLAPPRVEGGEFSPLPQPSTALNALPKNPCDLAFDIGYGNVFCSDTG